tara:strand:- start:101 stop:304 length:204 start_codon:yes stop_codon:yes gene_type:complete
VKLYNPDGTELMTVTAIERSGSKLIIKGNIFGTMPINTELRPSEARAGLKLLSLSKVAFLLSLLFRK